ncbi:MAG: hypothetical protein OXU25_03715 [Thaumarchaeota archaeon]|nr:hypothetical protein [Nitrososphaerota archaeon]
MSPRAAAAVALALSLAAPHAALAQEITLSAEQREYYFLVNEPVRLQVLVNSTHAGTVQGTIVSVFEQSAGGAQISRSNSNSVSVAPGESAIDVDLGTHAAPATMSVDLLLSYVEDGAKLVDLEPLVVHVVEEDAASQNVPSPTSATSQEAQLAQPQQQGGQQAQNAQQRLQNSQLAQDSSALRDEIREQIRQDAAEQEGILESAMASEEVAALHEELLERGYTPSSQSASASPAAQEAQDSQDAQDGGGQDGGAQDGAQGAQDGGAQGDSGSFELAYENAEGQWATIEGEVEGGEVTSAEVRTQEELDAALEALRADEEFQELAAGLEAEGYTEMAAEASRAAGGELEAAVTFAPPEGSAAAEARITATVANSTVADVRLERQGAEGGPAWIPLAAVAAAGAAAYAAWRLLRRRPRAALPALPAPAPRRRDPAAEASRLLEEAVRAFGGGRRKDAYGLAGQALRLGLSHSSGLDVEASNTEVLRHLRERGALAPGVAECLGLAGLVSFARAEPGEEGFERVIAAAREAIPAARAP